MEKSNGKAKVKWARAEIKKRLKGKTLSSSERSRVFKDVWSEANSKFD